ncbi:MAG TPA: hypothetical protein VEQ37_00715 [Actinomycetota bacterium]|nr:hypothetical protein [Actinomycetota bacterium]
MAKKRKRRRPAGYRTDGGEVSSGSRPVRAGAARSTTARRSSVPARTVARQRVSSQASQPSPWGSLFGKRAPGGKRPPSLQPPVAVSLARGVSVVGRSPLLLVITFLAVLGLWLGFSGYGTVTSAAPQAMVLLISLPPIHTLLDIEFLARGRTVAAGEVLAFSVGLVLLRAVLMSLWASLILDSFRTGSSAPDTRSSLRRAIRSVVPMTGIELGFLILATIAIFLVTGFLGTLGVIAALVAGLYFFSFAPVIVVAEQVGTVRAAQLSIRAARVPGPQHMLLITTYLALTLFIAIVTPGSRVAAATPSVPVWAFALFVGFLHVAVLGAFVYRWLLIREHALAAADEGRGKQRTRTGA